MKTSEQKQEPFDPKQYLQDYFLEVDEEFERFYRFWCQVLGSLHGGGRALELGVGPSLYTAIPLAARFDEIHLADLLEGNLAEIDAWMKKKPNHFDWTQHIEHVLRLEGINPDLQAIKHREDQLRRKIRHLRTCDLRWDNPLGSPEEFDLVTTHYCTETASKDLQDWSDMIKRVTTLIRPGGALLLSVASGLQIIRVYDPRESTHVPPNITSNDVQDALTRAGMRLYSWDLVPGMEDDPYSGSVLSLSVKPLQPITPESLREHNSCLPSSGGICCRDDAEDVVLRELQRYPKLQLNKGLQGWALVVQQPIEEGEVVFQLRGEIVPEPSRYSLQIGENRHLWSTAWQADDFLDHSCDPNCTIYVTGSDMVNLVSIRGITVGEKLTFNYLTTEWDMAEPFDCDCGARDCFKRIAGFRYLSNQQKHTLEPLLTPYLKQKSRPRKK